MIHRLKHLVRQFLNSWASRTLAIGAVSTIVDLTTGRSLLALGFATVYATLCGLAVGSCFTFFANRSIAFQDATRSVGKPAIKFVIVTTLASLVHAQLTAWLHDSQKIDFVISKIIADICIFTVGQPLWLRYIVFPKGSTPSGNAASHSQTLR